MKNRKIIIIAVIILLLLTILAISFIVGTPSYSDTFSSMEIYEAVKNSFDTDGGSKILDDDVILEFTDKELDYLENYTVAKANNAKNINEVGIFKVQSGKTKEMEKIVSSYVDGMQQSYRAMDYFPEEVEKIDCAKVVVMGNYVIYSFLNEKDTESFYSAIKSLIQE